MKKIRVANNVKMVGEKNFTGREKLIDYYVVIPGKAERIYAFSKKYTNQTFGICKGGVRINELVGVRSRNTAIMTLVNYTKLVMPYLTEEYCIPVAAA